MAIYSHQYPLCICDTLILSFSCLKYYIAHIIFCGPQCQAFFGGVGNRIGSGNEFFMYLQAEKERKKKWEKKIIIYNPKEHDFITPRSHFLSEALLNVMRHVKNSCIYISLSIIYLLFKMRWTSRLCFHINFCVLNRTNLGKPYPQLASLCRVLITGTIVTWLKSC